MAKGEGKNLRSDGLCSLSNAMVSTQGGWQFTSVKMPSNDKAGNFEVKHPALVQAVKCPSDDAAERAWC